MRRTVLVFSALFLLTGPVLWAQAQGQAAAQPSQGAPLSEKEVVSGLKSKEPGRIVSLVSERGVDFDLTPDIEKKLRKAKADDALIDIIRKSGPTARAQAAKAGVQAGPRIAPEEYQAFRAIPNELDPEKAIQLVSDFEKKFPNSSLLTWAYTYAANAYQQKNDLANSIAYGEKSVKLKEDNLPSLMLLSSLIPQPQYLKDHEADKEKCLSDAEGYASKALKLLDDPATVPKQPNESDEQYNKRKESLASEAHASLGMVHLERSQLALQGPDKDELGKAEKEYQQAISMAGERPNAQDYYRLGEAFNLDGKVDEAIQAFTKAGELGQGSVIQKFAADRVQELQKRKAGGQPATKP